MSEAEGLADGLWAVALCPFRVALMHYGAKRTPSDVH
jgi:hypothetical protein